MKRRAVLAGIMAAPAVARAETAQARRLAIVSPSEPVSIMHENGGNPYYRVLYEDLRRLGHVEGKTLIVDRFGRENTAGGVEAMIAEVVRSKPDVIYAIGGGPLVKAATSTIPVVVLTGDPIALGLARSLARPGGNFTGVSVDTGPSLYGKRIEVLREVFPRLSTLAYVGARRAWDAFQGAPMRAAAEAARTGLIPALVDYPATEGDYRQAILAAHRQGADAIMVADSPEALQYRAAIVSVLAEARLPAIHTFPESVVTGGLIAYSFDLKELNRQAAKDIDAILKGANPAEIPFYQVSRLLLSINLGTAKALGLTVPPALLARADEVIE